MKAQQIRSALHKIWKLVDYCKNPKGRGAHSQGASKAQGVTGHARPMGNSQTASDAGARHTTHSNRQVFRIVDIGKDSSFEPLVEEHARRGLALETTLTQQRVRTGTGEIVDAKQLKSQCQFNGCGKFESTLYRCAVCGIALCRECAIETEKPGSGTVILCRTHYDEMVKNWNLWEAYDHFKKQGKSSNLKPRSPRSPQERNHS